MRFNIKYQLLAIALLIAPLFVSQAFAHGSTVPLHGGVVKIVGDMSFELVSGDNDVKLFLLSHSEEVDTSQLTAKLKLEYGGEKSEIELKPSGGNSFRADKVTLPAGSKVLVLVTLADTYSKIGANFTIE